MALIGCGSIAQAHWAGIQRVAKRVDVTAVVDKDPAALEAMVGRTQADGFAEIDEALNIGDFDAVDIMLPHALHEHAALICFAAGKHVLLEKPIAHNLESAERILRAGREAGSTFMIAEQSQYWPDIVAARQLIDDKAIGDVIAASGNFYDRVPEDLGVSPSWRYDLATSGGGVTIDGGAHWIRPLRMMMGEISEVIGIAGTHQPMMEGESWSRTLIKFESGSAGVLNCQNYAHAAGPADLFRVTGTKGELLITPGREGGLVLYNDSFPKGEIIMNGFEGRRDSYGEEIKNFSEVILDGAAMAASPEFSLGELRTALALYASIKSGRWERVW